MKPPPIEILRRWITDLDPSEPLEAGDRRYVNLDEGKGGRKGSGASSVEVLFNNLALERPEGSSKQLFTGFPGSGKSTELHRLTRRLESEARAVVILIRAGEFIDPYVPPSISDFLRVLAWEMDRAATRAEGGDPDKAPGYARRFWDWLKSDVQIQQIGFDKLGFKVMAQMKSSPSFRRQVDEHLSRNFQAFATEARLAMEDAVRRIRAATGREQVVVLVDDLEKFQPLRPENIDEMESSVEAVYQQHAEWLSIPCHVVYTFPYWLRWRTVQLGSAYDGRPVVLPMVKVHEPSGADCPEGLGLLREMMARRIDLEAVFGPEPRAALDLALRASGGYPRDAVRLLRDTIRATRSFPVSEGVAEQVIRDLAEEYELVALRSDAEVLAHISRDHSLPEGEDGQRLAGHLILRNLVLTYRNGRDWYDLHPLVAASPRIQERLRPR